MGKYQDCISQLIRSIDESVEKLWPHLVNELSAEVEAVSIQEARTLNKAL